MELSASARRQLTDDGKVPAVAEVLFWHDRRSTARTKTPVTIVR